MPLFKKINPRRSQVRRTISAERLLRLTRSVDTDVIKSVLLWASFIVLCVAVFSFGQIQHASSGALVSLAGLVLVIALAAGFYICRYQAKLLRNHARAFALAGLFVLLLAITRLGVLSAGNASWAGSWGTATAVIAAIILSIAYDQRFAIGMSMFYCLLACLALGPALNTQHQLPGISSFLTMAAGAVTCCFSLKEIRTRMKLLEVSVIAATIVFVTAVCAASISFAGQPPATTDTLKWAGYHAAAALLVGLLVQSLLPVIEKIFRIATSMTLLDYSDANQPLLKRLAMDAPGTFSHSLLIGSIAEAAAEAIGCNGLMCRVGAYYHDVGKTNKPKYFVENELGLASRHKELSPAMSQLIIVGHVKDGVELAREYGLPSVLRQFIETHHGTTLVEPFYKEARKKYEAPPRGSGRAREPKGPPPSESEFRYPGPKPRTKESAIVMLADTVEGAIRSLSEVTPGKIETVIHNMAMKRLQDGQFDECDLSLRELSRIESSMSKTLAAHYHARIAYPTAPDTPEDQQSQHRQPELKTADN